MRIHLLLIGLCVITGCSFQKREAFRRPPNILLIMTDDQGYGDIGYHGNPLIRTPVMDSLARKGTRIDPFYVSPVCAPTRSSLMTGRYHLRTGVYDTYNGGAMMSSGEVTLAEVLAGRGYHTGMIGKWHLGDNHPMRPQDQGFQYVLMHKGGGIGQPGDDFGNHMRGDSSYFDPYLWENGQRVRRYGYCSDIFTDQAIDFLEDHSRDQPEDPFFLYLAFNAPHTPLQLPEKYYNEYRDLVQEAGDFGIAGGNLLSMNDSDQEDARRVYGMVSNIDDNLGRLWNVLHQLQLEENTVVVFLTDNGPQQRRYTAGLNQRKGSVMEGGIRVPCIWYWKGVIGGNRVVEHPAAHIDVMPTLLDFAGIRHEGPLDGISLKGILLEEEESMEERPLFFVWERSFPQRYSNMAVRRGDYKLVGQVPHGQPDTMLQLYQLSEDPFELRNLGSAKTEVRDSLRSELDRWYEEVMSSPHLVDPPRIILGSPHENPVMLGRNDWKGPVARQWNRADAFGFWDLHVVDPGPYRVTLVFRDPFPGQGRINISSGSRQYWNIHRDTSATEISLDEIYLNTGDQSFSAWFQHGGKMYTPFYISIHKPDNPAIN
jgi:arylsulfatase